MRHLRATPICKAVKIFSRSAPETRGTILRFPFLIHTAFSTFYSYYYGTRGRVTWHSLIFPGIKIHIGQIIGSSIQSFFEISVLTSHQCVDLGQNKRFYVKFRTRQIGSSRPLNSVQYGNGSSRPRRRIFISIQFHLHFIQESFQFLIFLFFKINQKTI